MNTAQVIFLWSKRTGHGGETVVIDSYHFGTLTVRGQTHRSDLKIIGDRVIGNWWRREGHLLYAEDIADILKAPVDILVVGRGDPGNMGVSEEAARVLASKGIKLLALPTAEAVAAFNSLLARGERVAGAFHLTC
jgi:hypothetical protein